MTNIPYFRPSHAALPWGWRPSETAAARELRAYLESEWKGDGAWLHRQAHRVARSPWTRFLGWVRGVGALPRETGSRLRADSTPRPTAADEARRRSAVAWIQAVPAVGEKDARSPRSLPTDYIDVES